MTAMVDIVNRALAALGTRTTVTAAELATNGSNEAIQANLIYAPYRNQLLRLAPWNCCFNTATLTFITSVPGTPENGSPATTLWQKGQPAPPWAYEYQYPADCLRACWITPQTATGFSGGVPITTAVTGGATSFWQGPPVKFKVAIDQFYSVSAYHILTAGHGYLQGDIVNLLTPANLGQTNVAPVGAPAFFRVDLVDVNGSAQQVSIVNQILGANPVSTGSYFQQAFISSNTFLYSSFLNTGSGLTIDPDTIIFGDQRVILTNQEFAILNYCKLVTDENVFDDDFQEAFVKVLAAGLVMALVGDKGTANMAISEANAKINVARGNDGNEGLTVNDVTPDWIRARGIAFLDGYSGPYSTGFDWGGLWPGFN